MPCEWGAFRAGCDRLTRVRDEEPALNRTGGAIVRYGQPQVESVEVGVYEIPDRSAGGGRHVGVVVDDDGAGGGTSRRSVRVGVDLLGRRQCHGGEGAVERRLCGRQSDGRARFE